jgi:hypothetical protein
MGIFKLTGDGPSSLKRGRGGEGSMVDAAVDVVKVLLAIGRS